MNPKHSRKLLVGVLLSCLMVWLGGCKVTAEDVETWKGTVKGPGKIVAVILADKYPDDLRVRAAIALIEMERQDVEGVQELQRALARLDGEKRQHIIEGMVPSLQALMRGANRAAGSTEGPSAEQTRAKDAAFLLIAQSSGQTQLVLTRSVIEWYTADFNGRSLAGSYSAEQVVRSLGAPAAAILVDAINSQLPQQALVKLAELIAQLGDPATKQRAAQRLVQVEQELESPQMIETLKPKVREALQASNNAQANDNNALTRIATYNREQMILDGALPAMKQLAGEAQVAERLLAIAEQRSADAVVTERRKRALMALEGGATAAHLQRLLALALTNSPDNPDDVRDYAFDRVGDIRSPEALPSLWPLVQDKANQRQRWRAGEMVLAIGGPAILAEFFSKLPTAADTAYAPEELAGYAQRMSQMTPVPTDLLRTQLSSPHWWAKVIALRYFERKGVLADVPQIQALRTDNTAVVGPGWETGYTVGKVAESAAGALIERLGTPAGAAH